jgi:hypothetical protein
MTYEDWKKLSSREQAEYKRQWMGLPLSNAKPLDELADNAAKDLAESLKSDTRIKAVIARRNDRNEPIIILTTVKDCRGVDLPNEFSGFRVVCFNQLEKTKYLKVWSTIFSQVLGWSSAQTLQWAKMWEDGLDGVTGPFYHRPPTYYAARAIVAHVVGDKLQGTRRIDLWKDIEKALSQQQQANFEDANPAAASHWQSVKDEISVILAPYRQESS